MRRRLPAARDALHLLTLGCLVGHPVLDVLSRHVEFFVSHRAGPLDILLVVVSLCFVAPLTLLMMEATAGLLSAGSQRAMHATAVGGLMMIASLPVLGALLGALDWLRLGAGALTGGLFALLYLYLPAWQSFVTALSPALVVVPGLFLLGSPAGTLVFRPAGPEVAAVRVARPAPVVMLVFDALPLVSLLDDDQQIDGEHFPAFGALAADATWYRNATTVADFTPLAVPAILTGRLPPDDGQPLLPTAADHPANLFTLLGGSYELRVSESLTQLCPEALCGPGLLPPPSFVNRRLLLSDTLVVALHVFLPENARRRLPQIDRTWQAFVDTRSSAAGRWLEAIAPHGLAALSRDRRSQVASFLGSITPTERPVLYYLHVMIPHEPYEYLPSGAGYLAGTVAADRHGSGLVWRDPVVTLDAHQRHLLQTGFADTVVAQIVARLRAQGLYDDALVIVTADHGASHHVGWPTRNIARQNVCDIMPVPLLVKHPGQRLAEVNDRNAQLIDVLPTIVAALGIDVAWPMDGRSLLSVGDAGPDRKTIFNLRGQRLDMDASLDCAEAVRRHRDMFRGRRDWGGLFALGPDAALVGRSVHSLVVANDPRLLITLDHAAAYEEVDPGGSFVPARVTGTLGGDGEDDGGVPLAIAVNGRIRTTTTSFRNATDEEVFSGLVPQAVFRSGANRVEVFRIDRAGDMPTLRRGARAG